MPDERLRKTFSMENYRWKALSRWPEETLQRHPQSLSEGFRHTSGVMGTDCRGAIKVAKKREYMKLKESTDNAKSRPTGHQQIL